MEDEKKEVVEAAPQQPAPEVEVTEFHKHEEELERADAAYATKRFSPWLPNVPISRPFRLI